MTKYPQAIGDWLAVVTSTWNPFTGEVEAGRVPLVCDQAWATKGDLFLKTMKPKPKQRNKQKRWLHFFLIETKISRKFLSFPWSSETSREEGFGPLCVLATFWYLWWLLSTLQWCVGKCLICSPSHKGARDACRAMWTIHLTDYGARARDSVVASTPEENAMSTHTSASLLK